MRIGIISHSMSRLNGGITEVVRRYCDALNAEGDHDIHVFAPRDKFSDADSDQYHNVTLHKLNALGIQRFPITPGATGALVDADLDILHVHGIWNMHGWHALQWHRKTGRPVFVAPHGMLEPWTWSASPLKKRIVSRLFQDQLFKSTACVHASTEPEAKEVSRLFPGIRTTVIANSIPLAPPVEGKPGWWTPEYEGRKVFVYLGRIHPKKGIREICEAWRGLCDSRPDFRSKALLVLCGWATRMPDFDELVTALAKDTGNVIYAGPQYGDDKGRTFAASDYLLLPSKSEGLPMAILDAWSAGLPSIMTPECNLPVGFHVGAAIQCGQTTQAVASAIVEAMGETAQRRAERSRAAQQLVATEFSAATIAGQLMDMYRSASPVGQ